MAGGSEGDGDSLAETPAQPRNWLQPFLLLSLERWQVHGYELVQRMTLYGFEGVDRGSVYRSLRSLEKNGLVESDWDTSKAGPARRIYSLSDAGRAYLDVWAASLRGYQSMLEQFFAFYPGMTSIGQPPTDDAPGGSDTGREAS